MLQPWRRFLAIFFVFILVSIGQQNFEDYVFNFPDVNFIEAHEHAMASTPHVAGSLNDLLTAEWVYNKFIEYGLTNVRYDNYTNLLQDPLTREITLFPENYQCTLNETDPSINPNSDTSSMIPTWLGYSGNGTVQGPLIYVNYGREEDFERLVNLNVNFTGAIALIRYGNLMRGTKILTAERYGCVGAILYSDPADDGYIWGDVYPTGPWRNSTSAQRGSIMDLGICAGNPSEERIQNECNSIFSLIPKIPALPLSYADAEHLLRSLTASRTPVGPESGWQGALPFHYHYGPGESSVYMKVESLTVDKPSWNVIGEITGSDSNEAPWMIGVGCHRDAWTFGALDPISGEAVLLEIVRTFGSLHKLGWTPKRTIVFYSWDSEEWGLIGSTTYAEKNAEELRNNMIAYLNLDTAVTNPKPTLVVEGTGGFIDIVLSDDITGKVVDPVNQRPLKQQMDNSLRTLGSGSDYAAFVHHLGIASYMSSFNFMGRSPGQYHSKYDDIENLEKNVDPGYIYHRTITQLYNLLLFRFANDVIVPFSYNGYLQRLKDYTAQLDLVIKQKNINLDLTALNDAIEDFEHAASTITESVNNLKASTDKAAIFALNTKLCFAERQFVNEPGLPLRHWFKHVLQAPGIGKGYASVIFPGIDDALLLDNITQAQEQLSLISEKVVGASNYLRGGPQSNELNNTTIIIVSVIGALMVVFIIAVVIYFRRRRYYHYLQFGNTWKDDESLLKKENK